MPPNRHLRRLTEVWDDAPCYFVTVCARHRNRVLANDPVHQILRSEWRGLEARHGWSVGPYVIMPDHVHFFVRHTHTQAAPLSTAIGRWKQWTAKQLQQGPLWQPEFFDHLLRSSESHSAKWTYVEQNPVRAGLVANPEDWPYRGWIHFE